MKKFLLGTVGLIALGAAPAFAADLPARTYTKAPAYVAALYDWSGFYIGVNGGGGVANDRSIIVNETFAGAPFVSGTWPGFGNFGSRNASGGFGGGQIGYNWQATSWVFGVEADIQGSGIKGSQGATLPYIVDPNTISVGTTEKLDWFGTVRGRLGYAWDRFMIYGTGGFAYGETKSALGMTDTFGFVAGNANTVTRTGYVVGGGAEYAFSPNWTVKAEYQYIDLGKGTLGATEFLAGAPTAFAVSNTTRYDYHTGRIGINYKWGGPVVAKY